MNKQKPQRKLILFSECLSLHQYKDTINFTRQVNPLVDKLGKSDDTLMCDAYSTIVYYLFYTKQFALPNGFNMGLEKAEEAEIKFPTLARS